MGVVELSCDIRRNENKSTIELQEQNKKTINFGPQPNNSEYYFETVYRCRRKVNFFLKFFY